jgi:purine-cytosine permease-like protein
MTIALILIGIGWSIVGAFIFGMLMEEMNVNDFGDTELKIWQWAILCFVCGPILWVFGIGYSLWHLFNKFVLNGKIK